MVRFDKCDDKAIKNFEQSMRKKKKKVKRTPKADAKYISRKNFPSFQDS